MVDNWVHIQFFCTVPFLIFFCLNKLIKKKNTDRKIYHQAYKYAQNCLDDKYMRHGLDKYCVVLCSRYSVMLCHVVFELCLGSCDKFPKNND